MMQKKICLLGAFSVGKTSLVKRYVSSLFDDKYLTTVGVKVDKKVLTLNDRDVTLMIWDIAGEDDYHSIKASYLRGASGYILVVDGTRPNTLDTALEIHELARSTLGEVPMVMALNKADLKTDWLIEQESLKDMPRLETSAKTGDNVEGLFSVLTEAML